MSNKILTLQTQIKQNPELVATEMDGEVVMMSVSTGKYYKMNSIASQIWPMIESPRTIQSVVDDLQKKFNVTQDECAKDVLEFLQNSVDKQVIEVVDSESI